MGLIAKIFGALSKDELAGASLTGDVLWQISNVKIASKFFRYMDLLLPENSIVFFEGTAVSQIIKDFYSSHPAGKTMRIRGGTIWPRPSSFHVPLKYMKELAVLAENCAEFEICDHLHAYADSVVLLEWYDAWFDPFYLAVQIAERQVSAFCELTGGANKKITRSQR